MPPSSAPAAPGAASADAPAPEARRPNSDAAETAPLLQHVGGIDPEAAGDAPEESKKASGKLPRGQIFLLCYARMTEPIAFFSIFPYIAQMVQRNGGLADSDVGFYSGLIESVFSLAQMCCLIFWGRLADRVGRKPVLVWSLVGMAVGPALFGVAASIWQMLLFRCLAGVFSGSGLVVRTMIGDHSTPETQALAFSWFGFAGNVGIFLGPIIGGLLAEPARHLPGLFGRSRFFVEYPYALPGFGIALVVATGAVTCTLFLEETLDKKTDATGLPGSAPDSGSDAGKMSISQLVKAPGVAIVLGLYSHVMLLAFVFTSIIPLALFSPVSLGGMGFTPFQITLYMAVQGASQAMWLLLVFPRLQRRMGTKGVLGVCSIAYPFFFAGYIVLNAMLRQGSEPAIVCFWILGFVVAVIGPGVSMAFTCVQLALQDISPDPHLLGTLNALALTLASAIRSFAPGVSTVVYAVGVRNQILYGHLAWVILIPLSAALYFITRRLPNGKPPISLE
ncbi:hypothetical protein HIM_04095 [Hirsutella minnesotensis 3608]|uniref:Major facilitator superfamily (MFS) profile domain-containing protein n=1 Tax=Hirsutella minnesotensis 3608 TaxID=1043627 RepID=A0A0F7ZLG3_9HYPO|nr:hypothetical protein HIM_04095 [Hirsutella minnesotensis 3608]